MAVWSKRRIAKGLQKYRDIALATGEYRNVTFNARLTLEHPNTVWLSLDMLMREPVDFGDTR